MKEKDIFYCKPKVTFKADDECWYYDCPIGHTLLSRKLNDMYIASGLASKGIHNHSLRATGISRLYNGGVPEKLIMERSGHLSKSGVRSYERTSELQKKEVSQLMSNTTTLQETTIHNVTVAESESEKEPTKNKENIFDIKDLHGCTINIKWLLNLLLIYLLPLFSFIFILLFNHFK